MLLTIDFIEEMLAVTYVDCACSTKLPIAVYSNTLPASTSNLFNAVATVQSLSQSD